MRNAPIVPALAARRELLMRCRPGRMVGREDILPASLRKATIEPVNVMPPDGLVSPAQDKEWVMMGRTNDNSQVRGDHMQRGNIRDVSKDTSDAREDGCKTHDRVQGCDCLR